MEMEFRHSWQTFILCLPGACLYKLRETSWEKLDELWTQNLSCQGLGWGSVHRGFGCLELSPSTADYTSELSGKQRD